jgi:8-oxo-dGTP diphosphatase
LGSKKPELNNPFSLLRGNISTAADFRGYVNVEMWYILYKNTVGDQHMTEVVAALIWDKDKFLICQRPTGKARPLLWEFVGGKVDPGETKEQALIRECREELAITLSMGNVFMDVVHEYPDLTVHLTLYNATIAAGIPQKLEHNDIRWIKAEEISQYEFCPADTLILEQLKRTQP